MLTLVSSSRIDEIIVVVFQCSPGVLSRIQLLPQQLIELVHLRLRHTSQVKLSKPFCNFM